VAILAERARETPAAEAALNAKDFDSATAITDEPWASALRSFIQDHEDEIALWSEIHVAPWNVDPTSLLRLVAATLAAGPLDRQDAGAEAAEAVRRRLAPVTSRSSKPRSR
jgi:hypothetical protein